jgi:hypothetical protein
MIGQFHIECAAMTGQGNSHNASGVNLPNVTPTAEDLNSIMSYSQNGNTGPIQYHEPEPEPLFGTHIREAVDIVRDWMGDSK